MNFTPPTFLKFIFLLSFYSSSAYAGLFSIGNRTGNCTLVCGELENQINANLPNADQSTYLKGMANSAVTAQKGTGVDYASNMKLVGFGGAIGVGADLGDNSTSDLISGDVDANQVTGFSATTALYFGFNAGVLSGKLGAVDTKRLNVYLNYLSVDAPDIDGLSGNSKSFGLHFQYKLIPVKSIGLGTFAWGGLDFTTGVEYSKMKLSFKKDFQESYSNGGNTATFNGTATVGADIQTTTIPLEISTNVHLLYVFNLYGGLGVDLSFGSAESISTLTGDVSVTGGTGTGSLDLGQKESPDLFSMKGFVGAQFNLAILKFYTQLTKGLTNDTLGVALGARIVW